MNQLRAAQNRSVQAQIARETKTAKGGAPAGGVRNPNLLREANRIQRTREPMEPINVGMPADLVLELDRMVEIGAAKNRGDAARLLMRKGLET